MIKKFRFAALIFSLAVGFSACNKDDETGKPEIDNFELGYQNSKTATLGNDLHIEAEVIADGKISSIQVTIHPEGDHHEKSTNAAADEEGWEFDSTYTKFSGLRNTTFHEHVDIPVTADTGSYHFHFIVTDLEGNQTELEEDLTLEQPDDEEAPVITILTSPASGQEFSNGQTISITGTVTDNQMIGGLYIGLVRDNQSLDDASVDATNTITLFHSHDFDSPDAHSFTASITVGAAKDNNSTPKDITGDLAWQTATDYLLVKSKDAFGGNWAYSAHYPVSIIF